MRYAATLLSVGGWLILGAPSHAQTPPAAWFVPPPPAKTSLTGSGTHIDAQQIGNVETIIVTAPPRPVQRDPRPEELHDFNPHHSEAAAPEQGNAGQGACKSSAYNTIAGQAATGVDMISMGGGHCD